MGALFHDPILFATVLGTNLPFLSMAIILLFTRHNQKLSSQISVGAILVSAVCAIFLLVKLLGAWPSSTRPCGSVPVNCTSPLAIISIR